MAKKKVNIIEKGLEEREETLMVKGIYDKLEDYRKEHPESSFMVISYNNKDKVGTSFLLGNEEDIAKECSDLMFYKNDNQVAKAFNSVFKKLLEVISRKWQRLQLLYYILYIIFLVPIVLLAVDDIRNKFKDLNR